MCQGKVSRQQYGGVDIVGAIAVEAQETAPALDSGKVNLVTRNDWTIVLSYWCSWFLTILTKYLSNRPFFCLLHPGLSRGLVRYIF